MKKNIILTSAIGYEWSDLEPMVISIDKSKTEAQKFAILYNPSDSLFGKMYDYGWWALKVNDFQFHQNWNICVERFMQYYHVLNTLRPNFEYVLAIDAKDVIFQNDPFKHKIFSEKPSVIESQEGLKYKNEPWGLNNIHNAFGERIKNSMIDTPIVNAGVTCGKVHSMAFLYRSIYTMCTGINHQTQGGGGPDQAAYNVLMTHQNAHSADDWACQAGTMADPSKIENFRPHLLCDEPVWDGERVLTSSGKPYSIVHQYDRVPLWNEYINREYRENAI